MSEKAKELLKEYNLKDAPDLREALNTLAWDCASGWLPSPHDLSLDDWSDEQLMWTSKNIIQSLTKGDDNEKEN